MHRLISPPLQLFLILSLALSASPSVAAHLPASSSLQVVREAFVVREFENIELPQSSVRAVHVCSDGYLWAGTREGLVQYKYGQQFIWQQTIDGVNGLPSGMVNTIYEDEDAIWVGTARGVGVIGNDDDGFRVVIQSPASRGAQLDIVEIVPISDQLYAVSTNGEILRLSQQGATPIRVQSSAGEPLDLTTAFVTSAATHDGHLLLGTSSEGVYRFSLQGELAILEQVYDGIGSIVRLTVSDDRLVYLDRDEGLRWQSLTSVHDRGENNPLAGGSHSYFRSMDAVSERNAWFGAGSSVVRVRGDQTDVVRLPGRGNQVRSISVDRAGNIWIGTYYGLFYALDSEFEVLRTPSVDDTATIAALAHANDRLYVGGEDLWYSDSERGAFTPLRSVDGTPIPGLRIDAQLGSQDPITALAATSDTLLVGYFAGGLDIVDLETMVAIPVLESEDQNFVNIGVSSFTEAGNNRWLASMFGYGLVELRLSREQGKLGYELRLLEPHTGLIGIHRIAEDRFLAVGQQNLLLVEFDTSGVMNAREFSPHPPGLVFTATPDGRGGLYLGVENSGILHLTKGMIDATSFEPKPLPGVLETIGNRTIWHLELDPDDTLWATSNNGVYVFELATQELVSHITQKHGLPANEFEYGPHASLRLPSGEKLFVSSRGTVGFHTPPQRGQRPIELMWSDISVDRVSVFAGLETGNPARIELPFSAVSDSVLSIEYGYLDHVSAIDAVYGMRIKGSEDWIPGGRPMVNMSGQQEWGLVGMEIAMLNNSQELISDPLALEIEILPPWYMLWKIDIRVAFPLTLAISLLVWAIQYRARLLRFAAVEEAERRRELMEAEMRGRLSEKEILLREIHHRVGNILSSFASNVRVMQRSAQSEETRSTLDQLNARLKVQSAVHSLLQRSDSTAINVGNMIRQVGAGVRDLFGNKRQADISLHFDDVFMTYSKAQYLGLIVNELLTNTYKHFVDLNDEIKVEICIERTEDGGARFHYQDNGPGIDEPTIEIALKKRGRSGPVGGLEQVVALARELKGNPEIATGVGMSFSFAIPAKLVQQKPIPLQKIEA
ncbi:MAG: two-component regulator propeller domain-containing protein [Pseudomonadota bacterium]